MSHREIERLEEENQWKPIVLSGVREYCEEMEVSLKIREGRAVIDALNEAGHNGTEVDRLPLTIDWMRCEYGL